MPGLMPNDGMLKGAQLLWGNAAAATEDFNVDLYQNNHTPVQASVAGDFTVCTFTGYATVAVARSTFGSASIVGALAQITSSVNPSYTCTGGATQTAYGLIITGQTSGKLYFAQLFTSGVVFNNGINLTITPFTLEFESI